MFEQFGWMLLAKRDKRTSKIKVYLESLSHLKAALTEKMEKTHDADRSKQIWKC